MGEEQVLRERGGRERVRICRCHSTVRLTSPPGRRGQRPRQRRRRPGRGMSPRPPAGAGAAAQKR